MSKLVELNDLNARLFAIGDIHGCPQELELLLNHLEAEQGLNQEDQVIFIGDYIDRGPDSFATVNQLVDFGKRFPNTIFLRGNHEDMLLDFLGYGGSNGDVFLENGGRETLRSYGFENAEGIQDVADRFPAEHLSFYLNLQAYVLTPEFVFAHAGLNPLRALKTQLAQDLYWIRDEFIQNVHYFKRVVVFGHTPHVDVLVHLPYKLGIDTGLVFGNKLSCVELSTGQVFQILRDSKEVILSSLVKEQKVKV